MLVLLSIFLQVALSTSNQFNSSTCACGKIQQNQEQINIVGGQNAAKNEYPWQVRLMLKKNKRVMKWYNWYGHWFWYWKEETTYVQHCGGSLLDSTTILTAAHCIKGEKKDDIRVTLGEHDTSKHGDELYRSVISMDEHSNYNSQKNNNDFAIIKIKSVDFTLSVSPVCLPSTNVKYDDRLATVTGWGKLWTKGRNPSILQKVDINTMANKDCIKETYWTSSTITENMICARTKKSAWKNACFGDSGGPLVTKDGEPSYKLIGVVSFAGYNCADWDQPPVYARVTSVLDWIKEKMNQDEC